MINGLIANDKNENLSAVFEPNNWFLRVFSPHNDQAVSYTHLDVYKRQALDYLSVVHGPNNCFITNALEKLRDVALSSLSHSLERRFEQTALDLLAEIHPQRCTYLGQEPLLQMLRRSRDQANQLRIGTPKGIALTLSLIHICKVTLETNLRTEDAAPDVPLASVRRPQPFEKLDRRPRYSRGVGAAHQVGPEGRPQWYSCWCDMGCSPLRRPRSVVARGSSSVCSAC